MQQVIRRKAQTILSWHQNDRAYNLQHHISASIEVYVTQCVPRPARRHVSDHP